MAGERISGSRLYENSKDFKTYTKFTNASNFFPKFKHIDTASYVDDKRFHSSKSDLASTRAAVNRILERHNFDIISSSTDTMIDDTPYDLENGFEVLEITDDKPYEESFKNILVDISDDEENFMIISTVKILKRKRNNLIS